MIMMMIIMMIIIMIMIMIVMFFKITIDHGHQDHDYHGDHDDNHHDDNHHNHHYDDQCDHHHHDCDYAIIIVIINFRKQPMHTQSYAAQGQQSQRRG